MTDAPKYCMRLIHTHMDYITSTLTDVGSIINSLVRPYENAVWLLYTNAKVDHSSVITTISEIGTDMTQFFTTKRLCTGLTPGNISQPIRKKSVRLTCADVYLKPALLRVPHAVVNPNKLPYYKAKYELIMKRCGKKHTIIAVTRMILTASTICRLQRNTRIQPTFTKLI